MHFDSILVAIDGAQHSRYAAEVAWKLNKLTGASVTAIHVVDTKESDKLVNPEHAGFLTRAQYKGSLERIHSEMTLLGTALMEAYSRAAKENHVPSKTILAEGAPYQSICEHAQSFDLVVIGHIAATKDDVRLERRHRTRFSLAEGLAHGCPTPLLVVEALPKSFWYNTMSTLISTDHVSTAFLDRALQIATELSVRPNLICTGARANREPALELIDDLRSANPQLRNIPIRVKDQDEWNVDITARDWTSNFATGQTDGPELLMVPTREVGGERITVLDSDPSMLVRFASVPGLLLVPEDAPHLIPEPGERVVAL